MDTERADLEGDLGSVTDDEWRLAHEALSTDLIEQDAPRWLGELCEQFRYEWSPGVERGDRG